MMERSLEEIIEFIAAVYHTTPEEVREEMQSVLDEAQQSPEARDRWASIPRKGTDVTLEEFITYMANTCAPSAPEFLPQ